MEASIEMLLLLPREEPRDARDRCAEPLVTHYRWRHCSSGPGGQAVPWLPCISGTEVAAPREIPGPHGERAGPGEGKGAAPGSHGLAGGPEARSPPDCCLRLRPGTPGGLSTALA